MSRPANPSFSSAAQSHASDEALLQLARAVQRQDYHFTVVTPATHARVNHRYGHDPARGLRDVFGWNRRFQPSCLPPGIWDLMRSAGVASRCGDGWRSTVRMATLDGRLYLHSAYPTDAPDAVFFGPDTYRFAAALGEWLADTANPVCRAVDIGCGAGPGAVTIKADRPDAEVIAVDINPYALQLTRVNAALANTALQVQHSDLLSALDGPFDLIVANPPFMIDPAARTYRDGGGPLGLRLSVAILDAAMERLAPGGTLLLYTGVPILAGGGSGRSGQAGTDPLLAAIRQRFASGSINWRYREIDPDIFGEELASPAYAEIERIAAVLLVATAPAPLPN